VEDWPITWIIQAVCLRLYRWLLPFLHRVCEHGQTKHVFLLSVDSSPRVQCLSIISNNWSAPSVIQWSNCSLIEHCSNLLEPCRWLVIRSGSAWCHISWSKTTPCQYSHAQLSVTNSFMSVNSHVGSVGHAHRADIFIVMCVACRRTYNDRMTSRSQLI
jgi:hypothetical protein